MRVMSAMLVVVGLLSLAYTGVQYFAGDYQSDAEVRERFRRPAPLPGIPPAADPSREQSEQRAVAVAVTNALMFRAGPGVACVLAGVGLWLAGRARRRKEKGQWAGLLGAVLVGVAGGIVVGLLFCLVMYRPPVGGAIDPIDLGVANLSGSI